MTHSHNLKLMFDMIQKPSCGYLLLAYSTILFGLSTSCHQSGNPEAFETGHYQLEVIDSVMLPRLSEIKLVDYSETSAELLLMDKQTREMLVIDEEGTLLSTFQPHVEGPNYVGDWTNGWTFYGHDELIAYGNVYLHLLSKEGIRKKRIPYPIHASSTWSLDHNPKMIHNYKHDETENILVIVPGASGPPFKTQAYHDSLRQFVTMNINMGTHKTLSGKPKQSIYRTLGKHVDNGWPMIRQMTGALFAMTYAVEPRIYIRNVSNDSILKALDIPKAHVPEFTSIPFETDGVTDRTRINARVFAKSNKIILESIGRIPKKVMRDIRQIQDWPESDEYKMAIRQYVYRNYLVFDESGFLGKLDWNAGNVYYEMLSSEGGHLWLHRRYEDERDYHTFLKVRVVKSAL